MGIDPKYHQQVFGLFKRLHARDEYPGTGIGLAICQKVVERYGGEIWVESDHWARVDVSLHTSGMKLVYKAPGRARSVAVLAGAFNPPTAAHVALARRRARRR